MGTNAMGAWVGALRRAVRAVFAGGAARTSPTSPPPTPLVWTRLVSAPGRASGEVRRVALLTPYEAQTIVEDALRGGRGTRLELTVVSKIGGAGMAQVRDQFTWLADRGIDVTVHHGRGPSPLGEPFAPP